MSLFLCLALALVPPVAAGAEPAPDQATSDAEPAAFRGMDFLRLLSPDPKDRRRARRAVTASFAPADVPMALEVLRFLPDPELVAELWAWLEEGTGEDLDRDHDAAYRWLWAREVPPHPDYHRFESALYSRIDPRFAAYFDHADEPEPRIRLDEIRWGGVRQNGIPPLRDPAMVSADDAGAWLDDGDVVFGVEVNGDVRAYPKRILAWHELFTDTIGGVPVAGVYCTLCGSMIVYETEVDGVAHELGTSGFLYRSNKLMFDEATDSLWSTLGGTPVVGPLADDGIALPMRWVVTTTWGSWRAAHPDTTVLSKETGHHRDYGEGAAYREYFATDRLMFTVPELDERLPNKEPVLALRRGDDAVALRIAWLGKHPVHHDTVDGTDVVVVTTASGSRVYEAGGHRFAEVDGDVVVDTSGERWRVAEQALVHGEEQLGRVPSHEAFWFGWRAAYPQTRLVK